MFSEARQTEFWVGRFGHDDEGFFERIVFDLEFHRVCGKGVFELGVGGLFLERGGGVFSIVDAFASFCVFSAYLSLMTFI